MGSIATSVVGFVVYILVSRFVSRNIPSRSMRTMIRAMIVMVFVSISIADLGESVSKTTAQMGPIGASGGASSGGASEDLNRPLKQQETLAKLLER